ncbi:MAG TPA: hypothetical protein VMU94_25780 [Streptosporangiaceae bacterium]|nr:hypothetical protein [Streptosporangiaceae bacterium]
MTARFRPYPRYKASGLSWIDDVPSHWQIKRAKYLYREVDDRSTTGQEELLSVSHLTGVTPRREKNVTMFLAESNVGHKLCRPGDLVINTMWAWMAALGVSSHEGLVSPSYGVYRLLSNDLLPGYADRLLRTSTYAAEYTRRSTGVNSSRLRLYPEEFLRIPIIIPPKNEQGSISRFIEHIDRLAANYMRAKQNLLKLLSEQRQAIVHRAVAQGLETNVRSKDSGVQWLGQIPEPWEPLRLKYLITRIEQGWSPQCDAQPAGENEWGVLKVGCVNRDYFDPSQNKRLPPTLRAVSELEIGPRDILMSRANTRELLGLAAIVTETRSQLLLCDKLFRFRPLEQRAYGPFIVAVIRDKNSRVQIEASTNGASDSMQNIGQGVVKNLWLAVPPVDEQRRIVDRCAAGTAHIDVAVERERRLLALLREYRTRLISDVVTGQIDVREPAASLSDKRCEPDDLSLADEILGEATEADLDMDDLVEEVAE